MSSSRGTSSTTTTNRDGRVATDNGSVGVSSEGDVSVKIVADEAFELGETAVDAVVTGMNSILDANKATYDAFLDSHDRSNEALAQALFATQDAAKSESGQIGEQLVKVAVPAAMIAFVAYALMGK